MNTRNPNSLAKHRGRPRKGTNEVAQEEKRARGRRAQKTMQLKRQTAFAQLKKRNIGLEDTIEGMSNEFVKFGERAVLWSHKGQVLEDVKDTTEKFLSMAREAEKMNREQATTLEEESAPKNEEGGNSPSGNDASPLSNALSQNRIHPPSIPTDFGSLFNISLPNLERVSDPFLTGSSSGQFSPRLGFGLANTSIHNWPPANPWDQYYISGPKSFALHLYIDSVNLIVSVLRGELNILSFIPSIARYYFHHGTPDRLIMLITLMVEKLRILDIEEEMSDGRIAMLSAVDYRLINEVILGVVKEVYIEEGDLRDWLDPWGVQTYLMEKWRVEFAGSAAKINVSAGGLGTVDPRLLARPPSENDSAAESYVAVDIKTLNYKLAIFSVCFGEGPRYSKTKIDMIVQELLNEWSITY